MQKLFFRHFFAFFYQAFVKEIIFISLKLWIESSIKKYNINKKILIKN